MLQFVKECFHIPIQIIVDGSIQFSSNIWFDVLWSDSGDPLNTDSGESTLNGVIWYRNETTPTTLEKILGHIKRAYPSVSQVDHVFIVTWCNITNPQFHNGRVSKAL